MIIGAHRMAIAGEPTAFERLESLVGNWEAKTVAQERKRATSARCSIGARTKAFNGRQILDTFATLLLDGVM